MAATASGVGGPEESARSKRKLTLYKDIQAKHDQPSLFDAEPVAENWVRPVVRGDCEPLPRPCPHCGALVVMRVGEYVVKEEIVSGNRGGSTGGTLDRDQSCIAESLQLPHRHIQDSDVELSMQVRDGEGCGRPRNAEGTVEKLRMPESGHTYFETDETLDVRDPGILRLDRDEDKVLGPGYSVLPALRRQGDSGVRTMGGDEFIPGIPGGHGTATESGTFDRPDQREWELRAGELSLGDGHGADEQPPIFSCPDCGGGVSHNIGMGGKDWDWEVYNPRKDHARVGPGAGSKDEAVVRNHCRPCINLLCRYHLGVDIDPAGNLTLMAPDPTEMAETCALDFADRHELGAPLDAVSEAMNLSRERVSQIEHRGSAKIRLAMGRESIDE